jgi:hypothetical protein
VVLAVPFFADECVFKGVLIGFMDVLPWGEDIEAMCHVGMLALHPVTLSESSLLVLAGSRGKA